MPTLVIRVVLVQLFGLVGQSGKVDGSFAPTRASSTADSQLAIHPSHLRVYSQIKTQAGLPAMGPLQTRKILETYGSKMVDPVVLRPDNSVCAFAASASANRWLISIRTLPLLIIENRSSAIACKSFGLLA